MPLNWLRSSGENSYIATTEYYRAHLVKGHIDYPEHWTLKCLALDLDYYPLAGIETGLDTATVLAEKKLLECSIRNLGKATSLVLQLGGTLETCLDWLVDYVNLQIACDKKALLYWATAKQSLLDAKETIFSGLIDLVRIPGGTFTQGSPSEEKMRETNEHQALVQVDNFEIGVYPVTQKQWELVASLPKQKIDLAAHPSHFKGKERPVESVTWYEAVEFCDRLSAFTGLVWRLPTEAEWEYACRAGTVTPFHFGETITSELANYDSDYEYGVGYNPKSNARGISLQQTTDVGKFPPNNFGLFDMHGNVAEWCENGTIRGGSWWSRPEDCRSANRYKVGESDKGSGVGFRVVRDRPSC